MKLTKKQKEVIDLMQVGYTIGRSDFTSLCFAMPNSTTFDGAKTFQIQTLKSLEKKGIIRKQDSSVCRYIYILTQTNHTL